MAPSELQPDLSTTPLTATVGPTSLPVLIDPSPDGVLDPVDVNVVFDNTDAGTASPPESDGTATVDFELTVTKQPT